MHIDHNQLGAFVVTVSIAFRWHESMQPRTRKQLFIQGNSQQVTWADTQFCKLVAGVEGELLSHHKAAGTGYCDQGVDSKKVAFSGRMPIQAIEFVSYWQPELPPPIPLLIIGERCSRRTSKRSGQRPES